MASVDWENIHFGNKVKRLIMTVGLPRSGKSTWAARCAELYGWVIVNTDSVRIATHGHRFWREAESLVWATTEIMVRSLFITGHSVVVLDATNVQRTLRDKWARLGRWETWYRQFDVSATTCMKRASGDEVLLEVIESMSARYNRLSGEELDRLVILPGE